MGSDPMGYCIFVAGYFALKLAKEWIVLIIGGLGFDSILNRDLFFDLMSLFCDFMRPYLFD